MQGYDIPQGSASFPLVFLLVSSSDHISALTGAAPTVTLSKNGGSFAAPAGVVTEIGSGWYKVAGNGTDTGTLGPLLLHATASGADPTDCLYPVVAYNPQSATNLGLSSLPTANPAASGGLPTADASNGVKLSVGTGAGQVNVSSGKVPATMGSGDYAGNTPQTGDSFARIGAAGAGLTSLAPAATALSTATWTGALAGYLANLNVGGPVASHADATSLSAQVGTPMQSSSYTAPDNADIAAILSLLTGLLVSSDHAQLTAHALANAPGSGGGDPLAEAVPGSYAAGTAGYVLGTYLDAAISSRLATAGYTAPDNADIAILLSKFNALLATDPTQFSTHALSLAPTGSGGGDPLAEAVPGSYAAGTAGHVLGTYLDAAVSSRLSTAAAPPNFGALAIGPNGDVKIQGSVKRDQALAAFEFLMVSSADGRTPALGKSITARRSIDGAATAACANPATEVGDGLYSIDLAASDLNGNVITLEFAAADCDTTFVTIVTQP